MYRHQMNLNHKDYFRILLKYFKKNEYLNHIDLAIKDVGNKYVYNDLYNFKTTRFEFSEYQLYDYYEFHFTCNVVDGLLLLKSFHDRSEMLLMRFGCALSGIRNGRYFFAGQVLK